MINTRVTREPYVNPDSAALAPLVINQKRITLFRQPELLFAWEASSGFDHRGWRACKGKGMLYPERTGLPVLQPALVAYKGQPSIMAPDGTVQLWDGGDNLYPEDTHTLVVVGRPGPDDNVFIVGAATNGDPNTTRAIMTGANVNDGTQSYLVNGAGSAGPGLTNIGVTPMRYADGPMVLEMSHQVQDLSAAGDQLHIRRRSIATGAIDERSADAVAGNIGNTHREMHVFGVNAYGSAIGGSSNGADIFGIYLFNQATHVRTDLRTKLDDYLTDLFAIPDA